MKDRVKEKMRHTKAYEKGRENMPISFALFGDDSCK